MGFGKYNTKQRIIVRKIRDLEDQQKRYRNMWIKKDMQINILKHKLNEYT